MPKIELAKCHAAQILTSILLLFFVTRKIKWIFSSSEVDTERMNERRKKERMMHNSEEKKSHLDTLNCIIYRPRLCDHRKIRDDKSARIRNNNF